MPSSDAVVWEVVLSDAVFWDALLSDMDDGCRNGRAVTEVVAPFIVTGSGGKFLQTVANCLLQCPQQVSPIVIVAATVNNTSGFVI